MISTMSAAVARGLCPGADITEAYTEYYDWDKIDVPTGFRTAVAHAFSRLTVVRRKPHQRRGKPRPKQDILPDLISVARKRSEKLAEVPHVKVPVVIRVETIDSALFADFRNVMTRTLHTIEQCGKVFEGDVPVIIEVESARFIGNRIDYQVHPTITLVEQVQFASRSLPES